MKSWAEHSVAAIVGEADNSSERAEFVRDGILRVIHQGLLTPGQRLVEAKLCKMFNVPRGYVREALARLESEGIVEIIPFRGASVRSFTADEARNIDLTITALMALAARQAAGRIDSETERATLTEAFRAMEPFASGTDFMPYVGARMHFYQTIISISGNTEIARICPLMQGQMTKRQTWLSYDEAHHAERLERYRLVYDAIMAGDGPGADVAFWNTLIFELH